MPRVANGRQSFVFITENDYFYVDKSLFLREWFESGDQVTLITRPRRFGKTLTLDMVNCFFSQTFANHKPQNMVAFYQQTVSQIAELYRQHVYLLESDLLGLTEKEHFHAFLDACQITPLPKLLDGTINPVYEAFISVRKKCPWMN